MGFNKVYQCLLAIFPQVDSRILKAVAIENSKDVDAAAEIVLSEIIPYMSRRTAVASSSSQNPGSPVQLNEDEEESNQLRQRKVFIGKRTCSSTEPLSETSDVVKDTCLTDAAGDVDSLEAPIAAANSKFHENSNSEAADIGTEELILLGSTKIKINKSSFSLNASESNNSLLHANLEAKESESSGKNLAPEIGVGFVRTPHFSPFDSADDSTSLPENTGSSGSSNDKLDGFGNLNVDLCSNSSLNETMVGEENAAGLGVPSYSHEQMLEGLRDDLHFESGSVIHSVHSDKQEKASVDLKSQQECIGEISNIEDDTFNPSVIHFVHSDKQEKAYVDLKSQQECIGEISNIEDDTFNPSVSRSSRTCRVDMLEDIIEDAKSNKKILFQTMQSIMSLMKEVELQEAAAEQAKEEAASRGMDILVKAEELKQMLPHAKEANDMHAGEVYGEKAILVTEVRELENRLLSLSEERDKSLSILDEMRQTLEARQSAAQELLKATEQEKLEKEESARNALAEQEAIMVKVVEESKILRQESEENFKLREFLMDRGRIVDSLQGEIFVICEDIRLLKHNFDERIPLSKSITSSQTSCILASSGSSLRSTSDLGLGQSETAKTPEKISPTSSVDGQSPKSSRSSKERRKAWKAADGKEPLDDDWEIFDRDDAF